MTLYCVLPASWTACVAGACNASPDQHCSWVDVFAQGRDHLEFVCRLKDVLPGRASFLRNMLAALPHAGFRVQACVELSASVSQ